MISKMEIEEKSLNSIAEFVGTSRQNIKKMLIPLENKGHGYMKDPNDKEKWLIDEPAAEVVRKIFALCLAGRGPLQGA